MTLLHNPLLLTLKLVCSSLLLMFTSVKDDNIPVSMQIRAMENGYPSKTILPFSDVSLNPEQVEISDNAAIPTRFTFQVCLY